MSTNDHDTSRKRTSDALDLRLMKRIHTDDAEFVETTLSNIRSYLLSKASKQHAKFMAKYLKIVEYDEGDILMGVKVPEIRLLSKSLGFLPFSVLRNLAKSSYHEERLLAVVNVTEKFKISQDPIVHESIFKFFVEEMREGINNWDLVDSSASQIVGAYLRDKPDLRRLWLFDKLVKSSRFWDRRIAIVATQNFIVHGQYEDTLKLAVILLHDKEDLIHKATGWTLREMGKMSKETLVKFLDQHAQSMPRIMLRYSIEKFSTQERKMYMKNGNR
ncbi:7191_t:CDS:2 [Acaulospora colombiana]|uniref:7191_t:CDS:1 n=1 Tax=Acaulospora colombiana TaxID=27376 RepID=A0ACA9M3V5_9GLOM|nr:7191_t:CDS:2 [Acaulospora colombiana]